MKYLIKNSFYLFWKSKIAMFLLAILIFLSTTTFTLLSSTSNAFNLSYNQVIYEGKLHDFTVKEKYSIKGHLVWNIYNVQQENGKTQFQLSVDLLNTNGDYKKAYINNKNDLNNIVNEKFIEFINSKENSENGLTFSNNSYIIKNSFLINNNLIPSANIINKIKNSSILIKVLSNVKSAFNKYIHNNYEKGFRETVLNKYNNYLYETKVKSITINSNKNSFKVVNGSNRDENVNKLVIFQGNDISKPQTRENLVRKMNRHIVNNKKLPDNTKLIYKGYKAVTYYDSYIPYSYYDVSSLMAVVSSSYFTENQLSTIKPSKVKNIYENALKYSKLNNPFQFMNKEIFKKYSKSIIWIDSTPYFIVGTGTTPDFSFPIIDQENPIPDTKHQANIFVNQNGYKRIEDAFRNNPRENYLSYRFKNSSNQHTKQKIIKDVEKIAHQKMSWGKNVSHIVSERYDTSESVIMAPHRISSINKIKITISAVTYLTSTLLILFVSLAVILIIKRKISGNKKTLGILLANGFSKYQIAFSITCIALIIAFVSTSFGYILGMSLQSSFILMFKNYWTLPVSLFNLDLISFLLTIIATAIGISFLSFIITMTQLKGSIPNIIYGTSNIGRNIGSKILSPIKWMSIKLRTSFALFFSNISKMILIFLSSVGSIVAISISISSYNKFNIAKNNSLNSTNYEYKIDLANPTAQGGLMRILPFEKIGVESVIPNKSINDPQINFNNLFESSYKNTYNGKSKFAVPNIDDEDNSKLPFYLDGLIQSKLLLNVFAGFSGIGVGPWQVADKLMPENQLNKANAQYNKFMDFTSKLDVNSKRKQLNNKSLTQSLLDLNYLSKSTDKNNQIIYSVKTDNFNKISAFDSSQVLNKKLNNNYDPKITTDEYNLLKQFIFNGLKEVINIYTNSNTSSSKRLENIPFLISYRNIISNKNDETFTRIEGNVYLKNIIKKTNRKNINIIGIKENTHFINFSNESIKNLISFNQKGYIPVVANKFFLYKYNKKVGDTFTYTVTNHRNRYIDNFKDPVIKLKIVGTHNSYANSQLYTLQKYSNYVLGWNKKNIPSGEQMFNGIFTKNKNSILFKTLSLYSLSGLYPGTGKIVRETTIGNNIQNYLSKNPIAGANDLDSFERKFSLSPYVMVYKNVNWKYTEKYQFDSLINISSKLVYIIQTIILVLAVLFILIISLMIILNNKRFISTMKVIGYRKKEISKIFFISFVPTIFIGFCFAIPISIGISEWLKIALLSFGEIFIPISITWWTFFVSIFITFLIVFVVYIISAKELRKISLQQAFE